MVPMADVTPAPSLAPLASVSERIGIKLNRETISAALLVLGLGIIIGAKLQRGTDHRCPECEQKKAEAQMFEAARDKYVRQAGAPGRTEHPSGPITIPRDVIVNEDTVTVVGDQSDAPKGLTGPAKDEPDSGGVVANGEAQYPYIPPPAEVLSE